MIENFDDFDITKVVLQYISDNKITVEQGLELVYRYVVTAMLEMQLWDIETAIDNNDSLGDVKNTWEAELDDAEKDLRELTKELNVEV